MIDLFLLKNGLRVALVPIKGSQSVTVLALIKGGSRYESPEEEGLAHFYEHMLFKGTQKYPSKKDWALKADQVGAEYNGATAQEYTFYYLKTAKNDLPVGLDLISQLVIYPLLKEEEIETERGVIKEEVHMYEDLPDLKAELELGKLLYPRHPLGKSGLGRPETIDRFKAKDFKNFGRRFYTAEKTVLVVAGGVGKKDRALIESFWGGMKKGKKQTFLPVGALGKKKLKKVNRSSDQIHLALGMRALPRSSSLRFAQTLFNIILGQGMSSRLFQRVREEEGLCYSVRSTVDLFQDTAVLEVQAGLNKKKLSLGRKRIREELFSLAEKGASDEELAKAKSFFRGQLVLQLEDSFRRALFYAKQAALEEKTLSPNEVMARIDAVSLADIKKVGRKIVDAKKIKEVLVGDLKDGQ